MDPTTKQTLVKAIQLVKSGDKQAAVPILAGLLRQDPTLVQAWYLLGLSVDEESRKIRAFNQVLKLDPSHQKAKTQLEKLQAAAPTPPEPQELSPAQPQETPPAEPTPPPIISEEPEPIPEPPQESQREEPLPSPPIASEDPSWQPQPVEDPEPESEPTEEPTLDEPAPFLQETPFTGDPDPENEAAGEKAIEDTPLPTDFDLPDWMDQESFDPSDYRAEDGDEIYLNTEADIPEWAQMNPFDEPKESEEEPAQVAPPPDGDDTYRPLWADEDSEEKYTGTYEEEPEVPDWATERPGYEEPDSGRYLPAGTDDASRVEAFFEEEDKQAELEEASEGDIEGDKAEETEDTDWLQEMVEEEGKGRKRRRKSLTPTEKKRRRRIIIYVILLFLAAAAGTAGYLYQEQLQPYWDKAKPYVDKVVDPIKTQAYPISVLLTEDAPLTNILTPGFFTSPTPTNTVPVQPTPVPTRTPGPTEPPPTATLRPTLLPGETPTITPTPEPLPNEVTSIMDQIESQVEGVRGLQGPAEKERLILVNSLLRQEMATFLINEEASAMLADKEIVLQSLGFINASYNLADSFLSIQADAIGGYYLPTEDKLYLVGNPADGFGAIEQYVYAHEYAHAIQDANYDLTGLGTFPLCEVPNQACQAVRAMVEGEANLVSQTWLDQFPPAGGLSNVLNYDPRPMLFQSSPPPYFEMDTIFADTYGSDFVQYLFDNGGWNSVNRAFSVLPTTTEQIIHPEKYQQREVAGVINAPDYSSLLSQEWELVTDDSLGEWDSFLLLAYNDYPNARQPEDDAALAAEGWSADRYQVYFNPEERQVFLSVYWVWDTNEDSAQYYNLLRLSLNSRFGSAEVDSGTSGTCWFYQGQKSCIQRDANKIYWLMSDSSELLDTVREQFNLFP